MAKTDPKDDRIAELELGLEAANQATAKAQAEAQAAGALKGEIAKLSESIKVRDARILALEGEVSGLKVTAGKEDKPTVVGLDPAKAIQLKISSLVINAITNARVYTVAGDVLCLKECFAEIQAHVGTTAAVYPISKDELEAAKTAGRAH
jgi:hypothetical protein